MWWAKNGHFAVHVWGLKMLVKVSKLTKRSIVKQHTRGILADRWQKWRIFKAALYLERQVTERSQRINIRRPRDLSLTRGLCALCADAGRYSNSATQTHTQGWGGGWWAATGPPSPTYLITYLLTPWSRVLHEKLKGSQVIKKFPAFYGTRTSITARTCLSLSWARWSIQFMPHIPLTENPS